MKIITTTILENIISKLMHTIYGVNNDLHACIATSSTQMDYMIFLYMYVATLYILTLETQHHNYLPTYMHSYIRDMYTHISVLCTMLLYNV